MDNRENVRKESKKAVLIIIPAYNEEKNIVPLLEKLEQPEITQFADVLVMNDASQDKTNHVTKKRNHTVITHVFNLGYGSGLQLGYKYAVRKGYRYVIQMDADGQHDVCNLLEIYKELQKEDENGKLPDIVLGSRFMEGSSGFSVSFAKKIAFVWFRIMLKTGTGRRITDPTTGLQGLNWRTFLFYSKYNNFDDKYPDANMLMQMLLLGFRVREIPAVMHVRTTGVSMHSGLKPVLYMFRMTFSIMAVWIREKILKLDPDKIHVGERATHCEYHYIHFHQKSIKKNKMTNEQTTEIILRKRTQSMQSDSCTLSGQERVSLSLLALPKYMHLSDTSSYSEILQKINDGITCQKNRMEGYYNLCACQILFIGFGNFIQIFTADKTFLNAMLFTGKYMIFWII